MRSLTMVMAVALLLLVAAPALARPMALSTDLYTKDSRGELVACANPLNARLVQGDERFSDGSVGKWYYYQGVAGEQILITMNSDLLDTLLFLYGPTGEIVAKDDDGGGNYNVRLEFTLPVDGTYKLLATTTTPGAASRPNQEIYGEFELKILSDYEGYATNAATVATGGTPAGQSAVARLAGLLIEFEQATKFDAQTAEWKNTRDNWVERANRAGDLATVTRLLVEFENSVKLSSQSSAWPARRDGWLAEVGRAASVAQLGALLKEFETSVTWEAMEDSWRTRRDGWLADINAGTGSTGSSAASVTAAPAAEGWTSGRLERGDQTHRDGSYLDYHSFQGRRGERVTIRLESSDFDPYLFLSGPNEYSESNDDADGSKNSRLTVTLPADGAYQIIVNSYGEGATMGDYRLLIQRGGAGSTTTATTTTTPAARNAIAFGRPVTGTLAAGDEPIHDGSLVDRYTFRGRAGQTITARLESSDFDPVLFLHGPNEYREQNDDAGENDRNSTLAVVLPVAGDYELIANSYGEGVHAGAYRLSLSEGGEVADFSAVTPASGSQLRPGTPVTGTLQRGGQTLEAGEFYRGYTLEARAGQAFTVELTSEAFDPYLLIRGPSEFSEDNNNYQGSGSRSRIEFSAPTAGTYRVYVTTEAPGQMGGYRLMVSDLAADRPVTVAAGSTTGGRAVRLELNRAVDARLGSGSGALTSGEYRDVYTYQGRRGERIAIEMTSTEVDPYVCLRGSGIEEDNDDAGDGSRNARLVWTLPAAGEYKIYATTYQAGQSGAYRIRVVPGGEDVPPIGPDHPPTPDNPWTPSGDQHVYGIFVGLSDYPGTENDLRLCADDARKLAESLRQAGASNASEQIVLLDGQATLSQVRAAFERMTPRVGPNDLFIFFHSGHGNQTEDLATSADRDRRDEMICLYDGNLMDTEMKQLLARINGRVTLIALDSCFSGGFRSALTRPEQMGLFSSEEDLTSAVPDKFQAGGYLSQFLRDGLLGACDTDQDRRVSAGELTEYLYRQYAAEATGVSSSNREGADSYQHLVVDRGGVKVNDLIMQLGQGSGGPKNR